SAHSKRTCSRRRRAAFSRASSSIGSEKSQPTTVPSGPTRRASSSARSPVPQHASSAASPGRSSARSAARARQRWCRPAVIAVFTRSYTPATRSNIVRTCAANSGDSRVGSRVWVAVIEAYVSETRARRGPHRAAPAHERPGSRAPTGSWKPGADSAEASRDFVPCLLEVGEEVGHLVELLLPEVRERGHDARTRLQGAQDRRA